MPDTKTGQVRKQKKTPGSSGASQYLSTTLGNNRLIAQVRASTSSNSIFLAIVAICLLSFGIALIVIFGSEDNKVSDLILIGSIMLVAGAIFIIMFVVSVCRAVAGRQKVTPGSEKDLARAEKRQTESRNRPNSGVMTYMNCCDPNTLITNEDIEQQRRPSAVSLYGNEGSSHERNKTSVVSLPPPVVLPVKCDSNDVIDVPFATDNIHSGNDDVFQDETHKNKVARGIKRAILGEDDSVPSSQSHIVDIPVTKQDADVTTDTLAVGTDKWDGEEDVLTRLYSDVQNNDDAIAVQSKDHIRELGSKILQQRNADMAETGCMFEDVSEEADLVTDKRCAEEDNSTSADVLTDLCADVDDNSVTMVTSTKKHIGELGSKILKINNDELPQSDDGIKNGKNEEDIAEADVMRISDAFGITESVSNTIQCTTPDTSKTQFDVTDSDNSDSNNSPSDWAVLTHDGQESKC